MDRKPQDIFGPQPAYTKKFLELARQASAAGFTVQELSRLLCVHIDTIQLWDMVYAEFAEAVRAGSAARTRRVEAAFFQRAVGYEHPSEELVKVVERTVTVSKTGRKKIVDKFKIIHEPTMRHVPADTKAGEFWLTNHDPERYRVRREEPPPSETKFVIEGGLPSEEELERQRSEPTTQEMKDAIDAPGKPHA